MTTTLRAQVSIPNSNGLPADIMTNTWHFESVSVDPMDDANDITDQLPAFYNAIDTIFSDSCDSPFGLKIYDLTAAEPRVPILTTTFAVTPSTGAPLPTECCIVLSFHGNPSSGVPQGRRRGRIFLGPLDGSVMDDVGGQSLIQAGTLTTIANAGSALIIAGETSGAKWAVFSPTIAGTPPWSSGTLDTATLTVVAGHVDNAFDIQRSRGVLATSRVTFAD